MINKNMLELGRTKSVIRELFTYGKILEAERGAENVFDFSLGNPCSPVPDFVLDTIKELSTKPGIHNYSPAQGDFSVRKKIADYNNDKWNVGLTPDSIYITTGAAAALSIVFSALNEKNDEFIVIAPFFPEYTVFVKACGGIPIIVPSNEDFSLNIEAISNAITKNTKGVIINSPNNPSGVVYSKKEIQALADLLRHKQAEYNTTIYLISDEPYREIVYGESVINPMCIYENTIICYSFSKSLSLAGERIGYISVSPKAYGERDVYNAICGAGRALGYVCAPTLFQHVICECLGKTADLEIYRKNRDLIYKIMCDLGFECVKPQGAFYLFAKCPCDPDFFFEACKEEGILVVPSDTFGVKGYIRIAYCVATDTIERSVPHFKAVAKKCGLIK